MFLNFLLCARSLRKAFKKARLMELHNATISEEIVRNAAAYGYEIGLGQPMVARLKASTWNPFLKADWRKDVIANDE